MYCREKNLPGFSQVFLVILKLFFKVEFFCIADDLIVEISKFFEEYKRGTATEVKAYYEAHPPKGEIGILIEGKNE